MDEHLESLLWHWGDAYQILRPRADVWIASRRDTHEKLSAATPEGLRDAIREDYTARPVPRGVPFSPPG